MNAVAAKDVPVDTYGGLLRANETPEHALRRLEKKSNYAKVIGTDEGQRLMAAAYAQVKAIPNGGIKDGRRAAGPLKGYSESAATALEGFKADVPADQPRKGLKDLREVSIGQSAITGVHLEDVPLDLVDVGENIRIDTGELAELAANIAELGILQPIRAIGPDSKGRYRAVWGQRRVLASRIAELTHIPALVEAAAEVEAAADVDAPGAKRSIEQLSENLQRKDLSAMEEADALRAVLDATKGLTQDALAKKLGRSGPWIANTLGLLKAPKPVQELVRSEQITAAHAKAISGLDADVAVRLAKSAAANGTSAHSLEESAKYERRNLAERAQHARLVPDAAARGLAALAKAGVAKDVPLYVNTDDWRIQDVEVRKLIAAEGYAVAAGFAPTGSQRWAKCDCTALSLRISSGDGSTLSPACVSNKHADALEKERRTSAQAKVNEEAAERKELVPLVMAAIPVELSGPLARLVLRVLDGMYGKTWAEYSKLTDGDVRKAIADRLTSENALRGSMYNGESKRIPIKTLIKELRGDGPVAAAAPAKHPRRRPPEAVVLVRDGDTLVCVGSNHVPGCSHVAAETPA